jgi:hypothetical protein
MNLGHYHALFCGHEYKPNSPKAKAFEATQERLVQAQLALLNYAVRFSHSYERWKIVINIQFPEQIFENMKLVPPGYKILKHPHWLIFVVTRGYRFHIQFHIE